MLEVHTEFDKISVQEACRVVSTRPGNAPSSSSTSKDKTADLMVRFVVICRSRQASRTKNNHFDCFRQLDNTVTMGESEQSATGRNKPALRANDIITMKRMEFHSGGSRMSGENMKESWQRGVKPNVPRTRLLQNKMVKF